MESPSRSVIVCTSGRRDALARCLASLRALDPPADQLIVVDNTEGGAEIEQLAGRVTARYLHEPVAGLSRARNAGARAADTDVVAFIDDDAVADPGWLRGLLAAFGDPRVAAATGRILPIDPGDAAAIAWSEASGEDFGVTPILLDTSSPRWFERVHFGGVGRGGNMAFRRAFFTAGHGFREDLGLPHPVLGEENFAFYELIREGQAIAYVPDAVVRHPTPRGVREVRERRRRVLRGSSAYVAFLLAEQGELRRETLRYVLGALAGRRRDWRAGPEASSSHGRLELLHSAAAGAGLYVRHRLAR